MIIFNFAFPTLNEYINAERSHKYKASNIKKVLTNKCSYVAQESNFKPIKEKVDIKFVWFTPDNRKDHDNISFAKKFILDGLVKAKILKDDSPKHVGDFIDKFELDKTRTYVSCAVYFYKV